MKNNSQILRGCLFLLLIAVSCKTEDKKFDATGTFEADEIIVSAEMTGKLLAFNLSEGDTVGKGKIVGRIDPLSIALQKEQVEASIGSLTQKSNDASPQIAVQTAARDAAQSNTGARAAIGCFTKRAKPRFKFGESRSRHAQAIR